MKVQILLSTYNGERYLEEQLQSLIKQKDVEIDILVRDDGSKDGTIDILNKWQDKGLLKWYTGPNLRSAGSFFDLLNQSGKADYYAFCDQDDYWHPDKLSSAIMFLSKADKSLPLLYFCNKNIVDENLNNATCKHHVFKQSSTQPFIESFTSGCCMVFNKNLLDIVVKHQPTVSVLHDRWMLIAACIFGVVLYDDIPHMDYRQHSNNVVGARHESIATKFYYLVKKRDRPQHIDVIAKNVLEQYSGMLSSETKKMLIMISTYRSSLLSKINMLFSSNYSRTGGSMTENIYFKLKILFEKL